MANEDVSVLNKMATSSPVEAAENVEGAEEFDITPEEFKASKETYTVALNDAKEPKVAHPAVARRMAKSTEHAAVVKDDLDIFSDWGKYMDLASDLYKGSDINRDMSDLFYEKAIGNDIGQEGQFQLDTLQERAEDLKGREDYGFSRAETLPLEVGVIGIDFFKGLYDNKEIIGSGAALGATVGALMAGIPTAIVTGGVGAIPAALFGARVGAFRVGGLATTVGIVRDTYRQSTGSVYRELYYNLKEIDPTLEDMAEDERRTIAVGAGAIMASLTFALPIMKFSKNIPWIRKILRPKLAAKYIQSAAGAPMKGAIRSIVSSGLSEALEEGSQEAVQIIAGEMGKTWDGSETSFIEAITTAGREYEKTVPRLVEAAALGGLAGGTFAAGATGLDPLISKVLGDKAVTPELDPEEQVISTPIVPENPNLPPVTKGLRAIQLKQILDKSFQVTNESKTNEVSPEEMDSIRQDMYDESGIGDLFMDKEDLNEWADNDEKASDIREAIGADILDGEVNAPVIIKASKMLRLMENYPELSGMVKGEPENPTANQYMARLEEAERKREEVKKTLGEEAIVETEEDEVISTKRTMNVVNKDIQLTEFAIDTAEEQKSTLETDLRDLQIKSTKNQTDSALIAEYEGLLKQADENIEGLNTELSTLVAEETQRARDEDVFNEDSYFEQETFTDEMNEILPKAEILQVNSAQLTARTEVADALKSDIDKKMNRIIDIDTEINLIQEREIETDRIESDEDIQLVDAYLDNSKAVGDLNEHQQERLAKGEPVFSINPESLSIGARNQFIEDVVLQKRKVFHKDGIDIKDAVVLFGAKNPSQLLRVLSETPTREKAIDNHVEAVRAEIEQEGVIDKDFVDSETAKAYDNMTKMHIKEMKILLKSSWPALKKGIKRVALDLPTLSNLKSKARERVGRTKLRHLRPNKWEVGERKSQRKAVQAILKNEVELAFREKENAAYNTQLARESRVSIGKVNNALKWMVRFRDARITNVLRDAGPSYVKAGEDIINLFGEGRKQGRVDKYNSWVKQLVKEGKGDYTIPDEVMAWLTTTESIGELTVDQTLALSNVLKNVYKQARMKNQLHKKYTAFHESQATHVISEEIETQLKDHPAYDIKKAQELPPVSAATPFKKVGKFFRVAGASLQNIKGATLQLDKGKEGGFFFNLLYVPIDQANLEIVKMTKRVRDIVDIGIEQYGKKDYSALGRTKVDIPEFKNSPGLNHGKLLKIDLLRLLMNLGNEGNIEAISNYGVSHDTIMKVLTRELGQRDFDFVQERIWNTFDELAPLLQKVHKTTTDTDLDMVSFKAFNAFGKEYKGGYFPIKLAFGTTTNNAIEVIGGIYDNMQGEVQSQPFAAYEGLVRSPHTKTRKGSKWIVDLDASLMGSVFDDVIHDIGMRIPVMDIQSILNDEKAALSIKSTIGTEKYGALLSNVARLTHNLGTQELIVHKEIGRFIINTLRHLENGTIVNFLMLSPSTFLINNLAFREIGAKMGAKGTARLALQSSKLTAMIMTGRGDKAFDFARDIDPSLYAFGEGVDDFSEGTLDGRIPKVRLLTNKTYHTIKSAQEAAVGLSLNGILGYQDMMFKTVAVMTAYDLYLAGEAPGHPASEVLAFSEEERIIRAKSYAHSVVASTTMRAKESDKASVQFDSKLMFATRLWNELRNVLNNRFQSVRNIGYDGKAMAEAAASGDFVKANIALQKGNGEVIKLIVLALIGSAMSNMVRGNEPFPLSDDEAEEIDLSLAQFGKLPEWTFDKLTSASGGYDMLKETFGSSIPGLRDALFGAETGRGASVPVLVSIGDIASSGRIGYDYVNNLVESASFSDAWSLINEKERKQVAAAVGSIVGGLPVSAYYKWKKLLGLDEKELAEFANGLPIPQGLGTVFTDESSEGFTESAVRVLKDFMSKFEDKPKFKEMVEEIDAAVKQFELPAKEEGIPQDVFEVIKFTESRGRWNVRNPRSTASGYYQIIDSTWKRVVNSKEGREAGLTMNGRFKRDAWQQEKAMKILTKWNVQALQRAKVPVNIEAIYYMHHFGNIGDAKKVFLGDPTASMKGSPTLSKANIKANPWLKGVKTAGDVRKGLRGLLRRGEKLWQNTF